MTFGEEICDILSDIDLTYNRSLVGWFFYESEDTTLPIAEVKWNGPRWTFWCDGSPDVEEFDTMEEAQDRCREWAKNTTSVIRENLENEVWDSTP